MKQKNINAVFIGHSHMNKQEFLVPELLRRCGYEMTQRHCYAPAQTFEGHIQNNLGIITEAQKEGIEQGRIGGWFSDEKCELLYEIARSKKDYLDQALSEMRYDAAFITGGLLEHQTTDLEETRGYFRRLCQMLRENNPHIQIVFVTGYAPLEDNPEELPLMLWAAKRLALEFDCRIAPVALAMRNAEELLPEAWFFRSKKDFHPNTQGCLLLSYSYITALFDGRPVGLPTHLSELVQPGDGHTQDEVFSLEESLGKAFLDIARATTQKIMEELDGLTLELLEKPIAIKAETSSDPWEADIRLLVIGNAYFDADGAVWRELTSGFKTRDQKTLHIETLTDDAATLESLLANNAGELTRHQQQIIEQVGQGAAAMGEGYDTDALDGMGDFQMKAALDFILERKVKLDQMLEMDMPWDAIIVQGFRGASEPAEHHFFESGEALIGKIKSTHPNVPVFLMQHWKYQGSEASEQQAINKNYEQLATQCNVQVIPVGESWLDIESQGLNLYAGKYTPNRIGVQVVSEKLRDTLLALPGL